MNVTIEELQEFIEISGWMEGEVKVFDANGDELEIATIAVDDERNILITTAKQTLERPAGM